MEDVRPTCTATVLFFLLIIDERGTHHGEN